MIVTERIQSKIRSTRRFAEILTVLHRHGFGGFVLASGLSRLLQDDGAPGEGGDDRGADAPGPESADGSSRDLPARVRLRMAFEELGPTFVKLGQILSTRSDLIPADVAHELRKLQDDAPHVAFAEIRAVLDREFNGCVDELFDAIDETPLAAASMAQVHRAVLADGTPVVIKVLRPGVEKIIESDMGVLRELAHFAQKHFESQPFTPVAVVEEFSKQVTKELDLAVEARSTSRLRRLFEDDPNVSFPRVFREHSTARVLTLEAIDGRILSGLDPATLSAEERRTVVVNGTDAVFKMCLEYGFFHADPHPGNMFLLDGGQLCFIDCGMTGHIDDRTADRLTRLIEAVVAGNVDAVIQTAVELADADPELLHDHALHADVAEFIDGFRVADGSLEDLRLGEMLQGFFDLLRHWKVRCPSDLVYLIKALMTIEGVGQEIDPTFDLVGHVKPMLERKVMSRYSLKALKERLTTSLGGYVGILEELPGDMRTLLRRARKQGLSITVDHKSLDGLTDTVDRASRTVAYGMVFAAVILGSSILILADSSADEPGWLSKLGFLGLAGVAFVALVLAVINLRKRGL